MTYIYLLLYAGVWEQWDTIVFPKESEHGVSEGLENTNRQITNIDLENQEIVAARCLGVYLNSYQIKLQTCDIISASFGISQMVYNVVLIFNQLKKRLIGYESRTGDRMYYSHKDWSSQKLNSVRFQFIREHGSVSLCRDGQKTKWRLQCKY